MGSFADEVAASLPKRLRLPDEIRQALDWLETNGAVQAYTRTGTRYASLFPNDDGLNGTLVTFHPADPSLALHWALVNSKESERIAPIIRTGGDGSHVALWLADDGTQKFVHMGSGSGSLLMCVMAQNAVDMLRLLAIGYMELCWPEQFAMTPRQASEDEGSEEDLVLPLAFRRFVSETFDVTIPETASEIVTATASMDDHASEDAFWQWIRTCESEAQG